MNLKEALAPDVLLARDICPVSNVKFDFLGYCFRPRQAKSSQNASVFCSFLPRLSASALKFMRAAIRDLTSENGPMCQWLTSLGSSIPSCGGLCITVDSGGRLWVNPSIRQSDNRGLDDAEVQTLYGVARPRPAAFSNDYLANVPGCSHNGRSAYAARSPDGSLVTRESHAGILERPAVRFRRPTRQSRLPGCVGATPNGRATRPRSTAVWVSCATGKTPFVSYSSASLSIQTGCAFST